MKLFKNQQGIAHMLIILLVLVMGATGFAGYKVYKSNKTTAPSTSSESAEKSTLQTSKSGFLTYTNKKHNYSISYPEAINNGFGACQKEPSSYRPKSASTKLTVIEDGDTTYLVTEQFYKLTGETQTADGISNFAGCELTKTTLSIVKDDSQSYYVNNIPVIVKDVSSDKEVEQATNDQVGPTFKYVSKAKSSKGNWFDITIGCVNEEDCVGGGKIILRHYPDQKKFLAIEIGQAANFIDPTDSDKFYDDLVIDSFKFL